MISNLSLDQQLARDDEYLNSGVSDPKIFITTSRRPSIRLLKFAKEIKLLIPNSQRINRGTHQMEELVEVCRNNEATDLIIGNQ